jgi:hypothetical protein
MGWGRQRRKCGTSLYVIYERAVAVNIPAAMLQHLVPCVSNRGQLEKQ